MSKLPTVEEIRNMTDEEVAALKKRLGKTLLIKLGLTIAVVGATVIVVKCLENRNEEEIVEIESQI